MWFTLTCSNHRDVTGPFVSFLKGRTSQRSDALVAGCRIAASEVGLPHERNRAHGHAAFLLRLFLASSPLPLLLPSLPPSTHTCSLPGSAFLPLAFIAIMLPGNCRKMTRSVGCVRGASRAMCLHIRHRRREDGQLERRCCH